MKRYVLVLAVVSLILSACCDAGDNNSKSATKDTVAKQEVVSEVSIKDFDSLAASMVGKKVIVKGLVDHVCKHGGKKLFLVSDDANVHVVHNERFADSLKGNEVRLVGVVKEFKLDETYCSHADEENQKALDEGKKTKEQFEKVKEHINGYRDSMKTAGKDHLSFYSLEFVEFK